MKTSLVCLCILLVPTLSIGQVKPIHFKKLQECLPTADLPGMQRQKPTGSSQTAMGMSSSEAAVSYRTPDTLQQEGDEPMQSFTYTVKIADFVGMPYALAAFAMMQDYENETESGYEKSVNVLGKYRGIEKGHSEEGYASCEVSFAVLNRFMVTISVSGKSDAALLETLAKATDITKLVSLATQ